MSDDNDVDIKFGANIEGVEEGSEKAGEALKQIKEHVDALKESGEQLHEIFATMLEAAGLEIGLDAFKEWVAASAELGEAMERAGAMLGVTGEQASELAGMAKLTGTSFDGLEHTMERFELGLASAGEKTSHVAEALRVLGLSAREFIGVPMPQQLAKMAEAFSHFADGPEKTAAAMALLGRSGAEMLPYLDRGKEGLEELHDVLERTGAIMSNEMVGSFAKVNEHINEMKLAWQGLSNEIFDVVKGPIDAAIVGFTHLVESLRPDQIRGAMISATQSVGAFAIMAGAEFENVRANVKTMAIEFDSAMKLVVEAAHLALAPINALTGGVRELVAIMTVASNVAPMLAKAMHDSGGSGAPVAGAGPYGGVGPAPNTPDDPRLQAALNVKAETEAIAGYTKTVMELFGKDPRTVRRGEGEGGPAESGKPAVPQMQLGGGGKDTGKDALQEEIAKLNELMDDYKELAKAKMKSLDDALAHQRVSVAAWLAASEDALADERQDVQATYQAEIAAAVGNAAKIAEIHRQEAKELAAIDLQMQEDSMKASDKIKQEWLSALSPIESAWNSQLRALLAGAETWGTAMKKIAADLVMNMIESFEKLAVEKAALGLGNLFGQGPGGLISSLFGGAGGGAQAAATTANTTALATLTAAITAQTAATATATAASGAGAAAGAGGLFSGVANLTHLFGFAEGTPYVQGTGLALLHAGEMVTPADLNPNNPANSLNFAGNRSGGGSGGGVTHNHHSHFGDIHVHNTGGELDPANVAKAMDKAVRSGAHTGLKAFAR